MEKITINRLPVQTWRYLKFNEKTIEAPDITVGSAEIRANEGITAENVVFSEELDRLNEKVGDIRREAFIAGKTPIYNEQRFMTGMGADADKYLAGSNVYSLRISADDDRSSDDVTEIKATGGCALFIYADPGQKIRIVINADEASFLSVRLFADYDSDVKIGIRGISDDRDASEIFIDFGAFLKTGAHCGFSQLVLGQRNIYTGVNADLSGDLSIFDGSLVYLRGKDQDEDISYNAVHRGRVTESDFDVKGVIFAGGHKTLRDTVDFRRGAVGAKASEQEDVLLAESDESGIVNRSIPLILCEEEDVDGRHGASIGRIDPKILVYMSSRGFSADEAKKMLIRGHIGMVARNIDGDTVRSADKYLDTILN